MKNRNWQPLAILIFSLAIIACKKSDLEKNVPGCVEKMIRKEKPAQVWEWAVDGKKYYYISPGNCDDCFNLLYDDNCNFICAPPGGFSGAGDGNCPDFNGQIEWTLI